MNTLIIDVEATCWNTPKEQEANKNEVIEIGWCMTDGKTYKYGDIYVIPQFSKISKFCTELTGITNNVIKDKGVSPKKAYSELNNMFSKVKVWASYGNYDKSILNSMSEAYKIKINMPKKHINIRQLASQKLNGSDDPYQVSSNPKDILENNLKIKFDGRNHNGMDDAKNIAVLYNKLNEMPIKESTDYFPY